MSEICLWSAMVDEAPTPYRYGVWGGFAAPRRHEIDAALGHPAVGEYRRRLHAAIEAWQAAGATSAAREAPDAA